MKKIFILIISAVITLTTYARGGEYLTNDFHGYVSPTIGIGAHELPDIYFFGGDIVFGFQAMDRLNVGFGIAPTYAYYSSNSDGYTMPIFAQIRYDDTNKKFSPTMSLRVGGNVGDIKGFHLSPGIGFRFGHFDLGVRYTEVFHSDYNCGYAQLSFGIVF